MTVIYTLNRHIMATLPMKTREMMKLGHYLTLKITRGKVKLKRWSKQKTKYVDFEIPQAVKAYNNSMGGTDQKDQNSNCSLIGIRGKKWWWSLFSWLVDVSIKNASSLEKVSNWSHRLICLSSPGRTN